MVSERAATESRESAEAIERMKSEAASFAPPLPPLPESEPRPAFPSRPHSHARSSGLRHIRRQLREPQPIRRRSSDRPCRHSDRRPCSVSMMVLLVLVLGVQLDKALKEQMHLEGERIKTKMMAAESEENYLQTKTLYSLSVLSTFS